jgi:hypothetical protein
MKKSPILSKSTLQSSLIFIVWMTGCTNITIYRNPLSELSESATRTRVAIETMSKEANRARVNKLALSAAMEGSRFGDGELGAIIPNEYISIRSEALRMIEHMTVRLLEVIDSDAGTIAAKRVEEAGLRTQTLAANLGETELARYSGPVSSLAGTVIRIYDQNKREDILHAAVTKGIPEAQAIIEILKEDFSPQSPTNINKILLQEQAQYVTYKIAQYNLILESQRGLSDRERKKPELQKARLAAIEEIIKAREALDSLNAFALIETLNALSQTLDNLKEVVNSNRNPKTFADFSRQLTEFTTRSIELLNAVNNIQRASPNTSG